MESQASRFFKDVTIYSLDDAPLSWPVGRLAKYVCAPAAQSGSIDTKTFARMGDGDLHLSRMMQSFVGEVSDIGFYLASEVSLKGRGFVFINDSIVDCVDLMPLYVFDQITNGQRDDLSARLPNRRYIEGLSLILPSEAYPIYGHWLLDILPRAWLYLNFIGRRFEDVNLILPSDAPKYGIEILCTFFGFDRSKIIFHDWYSEDIVLEKMILPSLLHNSHIFHPIMNQFVSYCVSLVKSPTRYEPNIFVSRKLFKESSTSYNRSMVNETDVINILAERGFRVVSPEALEWVEQIGQFSSANLIVGEAGSGLHNAIFSVPNSKILCIRPINQVQATIAGLRKQTICFVSPSEDDGSGKYFVDPSVIIESLESIAAAN